MSDVADLWGKPLRLLYFDIETAPLLTHIWRLRQNWVPPDMVIHDTFMLTWAAKFSDEDTVRSAKLTGNEAKNQDDKRIVTALADLIRKADIVVAHYGNKFDVPYVNGRVALHTLPPLGDVESIDTKALASRSFGPAVASKKLDYLARIFGYDGKHDIDFELWRDCYLGDTKALKRMLAYNENDVVLLEQVFHAMKPYAKGLPRLVDVVEYRQEVCPFCGSPDRKRDGEKRTKVNSFPRYRCGNCGRTHRGWQAIGSKKSGAIGI